MFNCQPFCNQWPKVRIKTHWSSRGRANAEGRTFPAEGDKAQDCGSSQAAYLAPLTLLQGAISPETGKTGRVHLLQAAK